MKRWRYVQGAPAIDLARRHSSAAVRAAAAAAATIALSQEDGDDKQNASTSVTSTYLYSFRHPSRFDDVDRRRADVTHGGVDDDLAYAFGAPLLAVTSATSSATTSEIDPFTASFTRPDSQLSEIIMNYWINFIRSGYVVYTLWSKKTSPFSSLSAMLQRDIATGGVSVCPSHAGN